MYLKLHFKIILKYVPFVVLRAARAQRADAALVRPWHGDVEIGSVSSAVFGRKGKN